MNESDKSYNLTFELRPEYLYACVEAESIDRGSALSYLTLVAGKCRELRTKKLLLDRRIPQMLDDANLFFATTDFLEMIRGIKTAFVNPYLDNDAAMQFAMTIGTNRGAYYQLFNTIEAAERWLLDD